MLVLEIYTTLLLRKGAKMRQQRRILNFIKQSNIALFYLVTIFSVLIMPFNFTLGVVLGGLLVTVNFKLMCRSIEEALTPPHYTPIGPALIKHYLRFMVSVIIISGLIIGGFVHPLGLVIGLSVVVISFLLAAFRESVRVFRKSGSGGK